jgi:hypothetical protein
MPRRDVKARNTLLAAPSVVGVAVLLSGTNVSPEAETVDFYAKCELHVAAAQVSGKRTMKFRAASRKACLWSVLMQQRNQIHTMYNFFRTHFRMIVTSAFVHQTAAFQDCSTGNLWGWFLAPSETRSPLDSRPQSTLGDLATAAIPGCL